MDTKLIKKTHQKAAMRVTTGLKENYFSLLRSGCARWEAGDLASSLPSFHAPFHFPLSPASLRHKEASAE